MNPGPQSDSEESWLQKAVEGFRKVFDLITKGLSAQRRIPPTNNKTYYYAEVQNLSEQFSRFQTKPSSKNIVALSNALDACSVNDRIFHFQYDEIKSSLKEFQQAEANRAKAAESKTSKDKKTMPAK